MKDIFFDKVRGKYIFLRPEEKVRQKLISYLIKEKHYPETLFSVEKKILNNGNVKNLRTDVIIYNKTFTKPVILIECKAENIKISNNALEQIMKYNSFVNALYIVLFNGNSLICWQNKGDKYISTPFPDYDQI